MSERLAQWSDNMTFNYLDSDTFLEPEFPLEADIEDQEVLEEDIPEEIGILTLKNTVLFPGVVIPITVGRDMSIKLVKDAYQQEGRRIGVVAQRNFSIESPKPEDLYKSGTIAKILKMIKMPDGSIYHRHTGPEPI